MKYTTVIWDFNGTLLDDVDASLAAVNDMLCARKAPPICRERFRALVDMPIVRFYRALPALENMPEEQIFREFGEGYARHRALARLADGALEALEALENARVRQIVLSSFEKRSIDEWLQRLGLARFFSEVLGADDNRAESKESRGVQWSAQNALTRENAVLVGDTEHDYDTARAMGADCVLVSCGHQPRERLTRLGAPVIGSLRELLPALEGARRSAAGGTEKNI